MLFKEHKKEMIKNYNAPQASECQMIDVKNEKINTDLRGHQTHANNWHHSFLIKSLHVWSERFIFKFELQCTMPSLRLDCLRANVLGHFRIGRSGFGVLNEIAINERYVNEQNADSYILGVLLHELLHSEQQAIGIGGKATKNNYHNSAFIDRAKSVGLIVDHSGHQEYAMPPTAFSQLLAQHRIDIPISPQDDPIEPKPIWTGSGNSKLKLWMCSCQPKPVRVRVAISDFHARCLKCGQLFRFITA
jgi:hypothetical protein